MDAYAGYYIEEEKLMESSSGGAVNAISERFAQNGGIVYGVSYSQDFYSAVYEYAESEEGVRKFRGSKYVYANKTIQKDSGIVSVYKDAVQKLGEGARILFTGTGCDIAALIGLAKRENANTERLFTIELICDGVTNEIVQKEFVSYIEGIYKSKVIKFSLRYKDGGWTPPYIYAEFENGKKYLEPFSESDYGFAFLNYKRKACYHCRFKDKNHFGDIVAGDFWGCRPGMDEYNKKGVSLLLVNTRKGDILLDCLRQQRFYLKKTDREYALCHNPRYFTSHEESPGWDLFDQIIKEKGLHEAVRSCLNITEPERFRDCVFSEVVLWGTGNCFRKYISVIRELFSAIRVVDSSEQRWGETLDYGLICESPDILDNKRDSFVLIMIENVNGAFQVVNALLDRNITAFDHIKNWIYYGKIQK